MNVLAVGRAGRGRATGGAINSRRIFGSIRLRSIRLSGLKKIATFCDPGHILRRPRKGNVTRGPTDPSELPRLQRDCRVGRPGGGSPVKFPAGQLFYGAHCRPFRDYFCRPFVLRLMPINIHRSMDVHGVH
jgi:hypothetical protein